MFMYTCIHGVYMWEAEPRLYWRVKVNGKWTWRTAKWASNEVHESFMVIAIEFPIPPEVIESE